jgi:hypothetical protein
MTIPEPTYITVDDVRDNSKILTIGTLSDDDLSFLIQTAEDQIDAYVRPQRHHPNDTNINRVFPRSQDYLRVGNGDGIDHFVETPEIPYKVSLACLRQVEYLFTQWWPNAGTGQLPVEREVESEDIGADGSYAATYRPVDLSAASLCDLAKAQLEGFVSRFTGLSTSHPNLP